MRTSIFALTVAASLGTACSGESAKQRVAADLAKDLQASAAKVELAGASQSAPAAVVSDIEQVRAAEPVPKRPEPRPTPVKSAAESPEVVAPQPEAQQQLPQPEAQAVTPAPSADAQETSPVPRVAVRPSPLSVDIPSSGARGDGRGSGVGIGDVVGIIIRGGGVDVDHCPPPRRRPTRRP